MRFRNRGVAAHELATRLEPYRDARPLVLGVPRAGVAMASVVAELLQAPLDVVLVHRLHAPGQPSITVGAVDDAGDVTRADQPVPVSAQDLAREVDRQRSVLRVRHHAYRHDGDDPIVLGRTVIIVDDVLLTGMSMLAAIRTVRRQGAARVIVGVAGASAEAGDLVHDAADALVCLIDVPSPVNMRDVFHDASPVDDDTVVELLQRARLALRDRKASDW